MRRSILRLEGDDWKVVRNVYTCIFVLQHYFIVVRSLTKQLDENLPSHIEEILKQSTPDEMPEKFVSDENLLQSDDSDEVTSPSYCLLMFKFKKQKILMNPFRMMIIMERNINLS